METYKGTIVPGSEILDSDLLSSNNEAITSSVSKMTSRFPLAVAARSAIGGALLFAASILPADNHSNQFLTNNSISKVEAASLPEYRLGFKALCDGLDQQVPNQCTQVMGSPTEDEHWGANGDSLQLTTNGMAAWRKADNWTAFTNGSRSWVNGPFGVMERGNDERFSWEAQKSPDQGLYLGKYQVLDNLEQTVNGKTYELQTLQATGAPYAVVINGGAKAQLSKLIAEEGQRNGFNNVRLIVLGQGEKPDGIQLFQETYRNAALGYFGVQRLNNNVDLYWRIDLRTPFNDPEFMQNGVNAVLGSRVIAATITGGNLDTDSMSSDQISRIVTASSWDGNAFNVVASTTK